MIALCVAILVIAAGLLVFFTHGFTHATTCKPGQGAKHTVTIQSGEVIPYKTSASLCDTLTIQNLDPRPRLIAFGVHDRHEPYDGTTEKLLQKGDDLTVTLNQSGTFTFHDHLQAFVQGLFVVSK